ncbi:penicillin acylase family protein [Nocardioides sp.]|uniref:penicillin acylase family protein n=1 Tax=Nocardioides sp. TaxID=35761 RepID=UPI002B278184|nr:penicillin acylase family protein [Nocardioides sp.]
MSADARPATPPQPSGRSTPWQQFRELPLGMRGSVYVASGLVLVLVVLALTSVVLVRRPLPQTSGALEVAGLEGNVEVLRDSSGIPQLYADSTEDLMLAQGFVAAQDRFFEMDVRRHTAAGRLAELFGEDAVASDVAVRTMGWRRVAEAELPLLAPETRTALDAYARGVNAYLAGRTTRQIALEYVVLGIGGVDYSPAPWTAVDSLAWLKAVAWDLRGNMQDEVDRVLAIAALGRERAAELYPAYPYEESDPIVGQGAVVDGVFEQDATDGGTRKPLRAPTGPALDALPGLDWLDDWKSSDAIGSNAWVVSGEHTDTGAPLLANDPHLGVSAPGPLLQVGLHCRNVGPACPYDVAGYSYAGVPGVVIGHNVDIAWGFTKMGADVSDLFVERVTDTTWKRGGKDLPLQRRTETISVEGGDDVTLTVRSTDHGPIISDVDDVLAEVAGLAPVRRRADEEYAVSLAWTGLTPTPTADAILQLNLARDWDSFREAVSSFAAPAENVVYADREGHIGYQAAGLVPIRKSGNDGRLPAAGWKSENDWTGEFVPFDGLPNVLDPEGGVLVAANQAVAGEDYPYFLTDDWDHGYRAQRITDLLGTAVSPTFDDTDKTVTLGEMAAMQLDDRNPLAPVLTPYLLAADLPDGYYSDGQQLLESWDFGQPADSAAAAYFNVVWSNLLAETFHDELPEALWPDGGQRWTAVVTALLEDPDHDFWDDVDTDERETRDDVVVAALRAARDELTRRVAIKADEWQWGALHELDLRSTSMSGRTLGGLFDSGGRSASGGGTAVNSTSWDAASGYDVTVAPAMRMVVSLADPDGIEGLDRSRWVSLTGASGHAFDDHFLDQAERWVEGRTVPWLFSEDAVRAAAEDSLVLTPPGGDAAE